jgi:mRNA-degrading endonuclease YafQ of YafQ-DinJ toxin-antitoxin module
MERYSRSKADFGTKSNPNELKLKGLRAFSAAFDLRVVYREEGGSITIILIDVGTHNQVY